jgi:arylsulfatase A-like enzyme
MPTILSWMGIEVPLQCDGRDLAPFLHDGTAPADWRTECHWEWDFRSPQTHMAEDFLGVTMEQCCLNVVRGERWKYVQFATDPEVLPPLLFDLEADPDQTVNLAGDRAHDVDRADAAAHLLSWRMRHDERTLTGHFLSPEAGLVVRRDPRR